MFSDLVTYLPDDILTKVDRASMAVSLEARVPILDYRVVEFSKKLPLDFKIRNGESKWILRNILYKYVPKELFERPKSGFGIPVGNWLRDDLRDWAEDLLNESEIKKEGILNPALIREIWKEHLADKGDWQYLLWDVLMFQAWKKKWM
jgi:asparagine synthase (glutamine-hydrolysing)